MAAGESLECQHHRSANSQGAGMGAAFSYSFILQILLTILGTGNTEMNMMDSFFAFTELIF